MVRDACFRPLLSTTTILVFSVVVSAESVTSRNLDDIFAPVVVGTPPVNAFNGLFRCPDGEIRHYGDDGFLFSRDSGLTWNHRRFGEVDASGKAAGGGRPLGMNPKTGTCLRMVGGKDGMYVLTIPGDGRLGNDVKLTPGRWHDLRFDWDDTQSSICTVTIDGKPSSLTLPLVRPSAGGISYGHFQALSDEEDQRGFLIESVDGGMSPR